MLIIDGSQGEGGGQVLRTSLALAVVTQTPVRVENIRAGRAKPGLMRQHLTAVHAAAAVGEARVVGAEVGARTIELHPGGLRAGEHVFRIGTAGSATLVLQTVLPALLLADAPSRLVLEGGTHNPLAPTFDFLDRVFFPILRRLGAGVHAKLERPGFYPAGGGRFFVEIQPAPLGRLELLERGALRAITAEAICAALPLDIARRELAVVRERLALPEEACRAVEVPRPIGPGNVVQIAVACEHATELFARVGERGVRAEVVAARATDEAEAWLRAGVPVGEHLADQLLLPLALGQGGVVRTVAPTRHTTTQIEVVQRFLPREIRCTPEDGSGAWRIEVR